MTENDLTYEEMDINSSELHVPHNSYQRTLSVTRAKRIAANFDERIANKPKVSFRDDSRQKLSLVDHRNSLLQAA